MKGLLRAVSANLSSSVWGYLLALIFGLVATLIWSSSLILIKVGTEYGGPVTSAGVRFLIAFAVLLPFLRGRLHGLTGPGAGRNWLLLLVTGFIGYTVMQWCAYAAIALIPATTTAFLMSFSPFFVVLLGTFLLRELPGVGQWCGFGLAAIGTYIFFSLPLTFDSPIGLTLGISAALSLALFNIFSRRVTRRRELGTLTLTAVPLGVGGVSLLVVGLLNEGMPALTWQFVAIVVWLAVVSSVFAYILWNRALIRLRAYELSILWALVPMDTALLDRVLRGTPLEVHQLAGMLALVIGALLVQYRGNPRQWIAWRRPAVDPAPRSAESV